MGNQLESALVIALRDTIKWESAGSGADSTFDADAGTLTSVIPDLPFDAKVYQARDRQLAYRDLIIGAAVVEVSVQVGDVWNYSTIKPGLQGPAPFSLPFAGSEAGTYSTQVRHVTNVSIPYDAARYADADLYGRDAIVYECLARACSATFIDPSIPQIDTAGTVIPSTSIWSLAEGTASQSDINVALPLDRDLFKKPDQNLADRDNQLAGYVAQLAQVLKNPFEHALRLYVQIEAYGTVQREPDIYALVSDGTHRVFQTEPAVGNRIVYDTNHQTLMWTRENVNEVHVPQIYAMTISGIDVGQLIETLAEVPERKDAQYWRSKAGQLNPNGIQVIDTDVFLRSTNTDATSGGVMQYGSASFTVPDQITFSMSGSLAPAAYRVSVLTKPNNRVEIAGAQNNSDTDGILGGATFDINVASGSIEDKFYLVLGGNGVVYDSGTYAPGDAFHGNAFVPNYTQVGPNTSTVRQYALNFALALPAGSWRCILEFTNLVGTVGAFNIKAEYVTPGADPVVVIQDTAPTVFTAENGVIASTPAAGFNVENPVAFTFSIYWTGGGAGGQLHIRKVIFVNTDILSGRYAMTGTFVGSEAQVDVVGNNGVPDVMRWTYSHFGGSHTGTNPFTINFTEEPTLPIQLQQVQVQELAYFVTTPLSENFQTWRQECVDRAERVIQQGYQTAISAMGTDIPTFRDSGSYWTWESTENWMALAELYHPRLREVPSIASDGIVPGRQYQVDTAFISYGGTIYTEGQKFYGVESAGTVYSGGTVNQVGAFKKSQPGHLGKPALVPYGLYFDDTENRVKAYFDTPYSMPTVMACQPWMIEQGIYVVQSEMWSPETIGLTIPEA